MNKKRVVADETPLVHSPFAALGARSAPAGNPPVDDGPVVDGPPPPVTRAPLAGAAKLVVRLERKGHGGKTVTVVEGLAPTARDATADRLKRALGTGVRVDESGALLVQGDHVARVIEWLTREGAPRVVRGT